VLLELERQDDDVFAWAKRHVTFMPWRTRFRPARPKSSRSFRSWWICVGADPSLIRSWSP